MTDQQSHFESLATWDEGHMAPIAEYLRDLGTPEAALAQLKVDLADPGNFELWKVQHVLELAETGADPDQAYRWWSEVYLASSKRRLAQLSKRKNPSDEVSEEREAAVELYKTFHRYDPKSLVEVSGFTIPKRVRRVGNGKWVTYRSGKVDPATLERPKKAVDYIHEHDAGVVVYMTDGKPDTNVPEEFTSAAALVRLGHNLGFCFVDDDGEQEAEGTAPLPDLYATPDGKCLLVVQSQKKVLAMMWGGALGVFARGIDG